MNKFLRSFNPLRSTSFFIVLVLTSASLRSYAQSPTLSYATQNLKVGTPVSISPVSSNVGAAGNYGPVLDFRQGERITLITRDGLGNLYYAIHDQNSNQMTVYKLAPGTSTPQITPVQNVAYLDDVIFDDATGDIYYSSSYYNAVYKVAGGTGTPEQVASGDYPTHLALDGKGNLYMRCHNGSRFFVKRHPLNGDPETTVLVENWGLKNLQSDNEGNVYFVEAGSLHMLPVNGGDRQQVFQPPSDAFFSTHVDFSGNYYFQESSAVTMYPAKSALRKNLFTTGSVRYFTSLAGIVYVTHNVEAKQITPWGGYFLKNPLPKGLQFNSTTGVISGTPTQPVAQKNYTVVAYNSTGSVEYNVSIAVDLELTDLKIGTSVLQPAFNASVTGYNAFASTVHTSVDITATSTDSLAVLTINGTPATQRQPLAVNVTEGNNVINVVVARNGVSKTYTVNITVHGGKPELSYASPKVYALNAPIPTLSPSSQWVEPLSTYSATSAVTSGTAVPTGQVFDRAGNLYIAGLSSGTIFKVAAGTTTKVAIASGFSSLWGIAVDGNGDIYVSESFVDSRIIKINAQTLERTVLGTDFDGPRGIAVDGAGNVYVADNGNNQLKKIPAGGGDPVVVASGFDQPMGVALDSLGNIYVSCFINGIYKLPAGGGLKEQLSAMTGNYGIKVDPAGNLYTVNNKNVYLLPADGSAPIAIAKTPAIGTTYDIAVNGAGEVYIADATARAIKKINPNGGYHLSWFLPAGMSFSGSTGMISGTPFSASPAQDYTAIAYNNNGGTKATVNIAVVAADANNPKLSNLAVSTGTLDPVFDSDTDTYAVTVDKLTSSVTLTPTAAEPTTIITVNNQPVSSGSGYNTALNFGDNAVIVRSTAQDGTLKTYTVTVTRERSAVATLAGLAINQGTLSPAFDSSVTDYTASARGFVTSFTITPTLTDTTAHITINGIAAPSGEAFTFNPLPGENAIEMLVTAQNDTTTNTYTLHFTRTQLADATLSSLSTEPEINAPAFESGIYNYIFTVDRKTYTDITAVTTDSLATITIDGQPAVSGELTRLNLVSGANNKLIIVTAENGTTTAIYTLNIYCNVSDVATLASLTAVPETIAPDFEAGVYNYTIDVNGKLYTDITPVTTDPSATISIDGQPVATGALTRLNLYAGENYKQLIVTAEDGVTTGTYNLTINCTVANDAQLSGLSIENQTIAPDFNSEVYDYSLSVTESFVRVMPLASHSGAAITIDGQPVTSGEYYRINLNGSINHKQVVVTAEDGTTRTYNLYIDRQLSSNALLSGIYTYPESINPAFDSNVLEYHMTVTNSLKTVVAFSLSNSTSSITLNGQPFTPDILAEINLVPGINHKEILVTAEDGSTLTYNLYINCPTSNNAMLSGFTVSKGTLSPNFDPQHTAYSVQLGREEEALDIMLTAVDSAATITVDGQPAVNGEPFRINVADEYSLKAIHVAASDGTTTRDYNFEIYKTGSPKLSSLSFIGHTISPAFNPNTYNYTLTAPSNGERIALYTAVNVAGVAIRVNSTENTNRSMAYVVNEGLDTVTIEVLKDDVVETTYTVIVNGTPAPNNLTGLTALVGTLTPTFSPGVKSYVLEVPEGEYYDYLTPTFSQDDVVINGQPATSGNPVGIFVNPVAYPISVVAKSGTGDNVSYNVLVTRPPSADADLTNITVNTGALSPGFNRNTVNYKVSVPETVTGIRLTPVVSNNNSIVKVNGVRVYSNNASANIPVILGDNSPITVEVTAAAGNKKTYTIVVRAEAPQMPVITKQPVDVHYYNSQPFSFTAKADNAATYLWELAYDNNGVPADFRRAQSYFDYAVVPDTDTTLNLRYNFANGHARLKATNSIGEYVYSDVVRFYEIENDHRLLTLVPDQGALSPVFDPEVTNYTLTLPNEAATVSFTPTPADPNVYEIGFNGVYTVAGNATPPISLTEGNNSISISRRTYGVPANKIYNVNVIRTPGPGTAILSDLTVSSGTLSPVFLSATNAYTLSVDNAVSSITVTPKVVYNGATVTVKGVNITPGTASAALPLALGLNAAIPVVVRSANGEVTNTYSITVTRHISPATITRQPLPQSSYRRGGPVKFSVATENAVSGIWQRRQQNASVYSNYNPNGSTAINNTDTLTVTYGAGKSYFRYAATNATGLTTYSDEVLYSIIENDSTLLNLTPDNGTLVPAFDPAIKNYTLSVQTEKIRLTPLTADKDAYVKVGNTYFDSNSSNNPFPEITLAPGENITPVEVRGSNYEAVQYYTVTVTRLATAIATLKSIAINNDRPTRSIDQATGIYTNTVLQQSVTITPEATDNSATITVNNVAVTSGSASAEIELSSGVNDIPIVVTSSDGSVTKNYTAKINRTVPLSDVTIASITLHTGETAIFDSETNTYNATINYSANLPYRYFTALTNDQYATAKYDGYSVPYGQQHFFYLEGGVNSMPIEVTAADGETKQTYSLVINKVPITGSAALESFGFNTASISDTLNRFEFTHYITVNPGDSYFTITPTLVDTSTRLYLTGGNEIPERSGVPTAPRPLPVGFSSMFVHINSPSSDYRTYNLRITRPVSNTLTGIGLTAGTLSPAFSTADTVYTVNVPVNVYSLAVTPQDNTETSSFNVNGVTVAGNARSVYYQLPDGNTLITIIAGEGTPQQKTYRITVNRKSLSANADLVSLAYDGGTLGTAFNPATTTYTGAIGSSVTSIHVTAQPADANAQVKVNGVPVTGGIDVDVVNGNNPINVEVTAENGLAVKNYTLNLLVGDPQATLGGLELVEPTIVKKKATGVNYRDYTAIVESSSIKVIATGWHAGAVIRINGQIVQSGVPSAPIELNIGANTINTVITSENGAASNTYSIVVTRTLPSTATLSALILDPAVEKRTATGPNYRDYTATVENEKSAITVAATPNDPLATIKINGISMAHGVATEPIALNVGPNTITTTVTAGNGVTTNVYSIVITRLRSSDATLAGLTINPDVAKSKVTGVNYRDYTAKVAADVRSVSITALTSHPDATIRVNGVPATSGIASAPIALNVGTTTVNTVVTAADGITTKTYSVVVTRPASVNTKLQTLTANQSAVVVKTGTNSYVTSVGSAVAQIKVKPMAEDKNAVVRVNNIIVERGSNSGLINLTGGTTYIDIKVTAANGTAFQNYTLAVSKTGSNNVTLKTLKLDPNVTIREPSTGNYAAVVSASISSVRLKPATEIAGSNIKVNGITVAFGAFSTPINVNTGPNVITILVTAEDGVTQKSYKLTVTKEAMETFAITSPVEEQRVTSPLEVTVSAAVSPNGDGINDRLVITGIEAYPKNTLSIMNSKGVQVVSIQGYDNINKAFEGRNQNGVQQPAGTYFYLLEYTVENEVKRKSGYIILKY